MGKGYVIQHCISFFHKENIQKSYQYYVTDLLLIIAKTQGSKLTTRYEDIVNPVVIEEDANEVISRIKNKLGGGE